MEVFEVVKNRMKTKKLYRTSSNVGYYLGNLQIKNGSEMWGKYYLDELVST